MEHKDGVFSLNYSRAKLTSIPEEVLKNKDTLIELDVSGNNFKDFHSVLEDLRKLTKLKKLKINIYTQEQAKLIIDSMPNLGYLNDEPITEEMDSEEEENYNEYNEEEDEDEVIINIPLIKLVDKTFQPIFKILQEFYDKNKTLENDFQKIIEDFNNLGKKLNIQQNYEIENLSVDEIKKKLELYKSLFNKMNKIKNEMNNKNIKNKYNQNSMKLLLNAIEENEKIKITCNKLLSLQYESYDKDKSSKNTNKNTNTNTNTNTNINNNIKSSKNSVNSNKNKNNNNQNKNAFKFYNQKNNNNKILQNSKNINNKLPLSSDENSNKNMFISNLNDTNKNSIEFIKKNRSFNNINDRASSINSGGKSQNRSVHSENKRTIKRPIYSNNKVKKYSKQANLIENYKNPNITKLLIKEKSTFDTLNIFDDECNDIIYKDKLNIRIINLNNLLEIINQIYKIRNNRIEKMKQGVYNKGTLEQDLYTYLKSKYGLKKLIIEWNINILSSIQTYIKINSEVYLFCLILRNELDEDSIIILNKIKKTVDNILNLIYDYDIKMIENIKQNKEFLRENEWNTISKCLYSDDNNLREKFINKVTDFIDKLVKGQDLISKTGRKILFSDFINLLIGFNLKLRKKYLHNLFLLFSQQDKKRTGIINLEGFKNIIRNCGIINDEQKLKEVSDDLIEIADKEGSGQITFSDAVQCLDNLDLIMDEGKVKFLDKLSEMKFQII